jgi:rhodanese-related sulfurtransferase
MLILDVREFPEYAAGHIPGSRLMPLGGLEQSARALARGEAIQLVCKSGKRAAQAREKLAAMGFERLSVLEGGFDAWQAAGQPVERAAGPAPMSLERQVRIVAGSLVAITTGLGLAVHPYFFGLTLLIGCGLVFAGATDICMMATLLGKMPWNAARAHTRC